MQSKTRVIVTFAILIVLVAGLYVFSNWFSLITGYTLGEDEKVVLAQCLDGKGARLYTSSTCPNCEDQIEIFGDAAAAFLNVVECNDAEVCPAERGVPAWRINGEFYYGKKTFNELYEISGCGVKN